MVSVNCNQWRHQWSIWNLPLATNATFFFPLEIRTVSIVLPCTERRRWLVVCTVFRLWGLRERLDNHLLHSIFRSQFYPLCTWIQVSWNIDTKQLQPDICVTVLVALKIVRYHANNWKKALALGMSWCVLFIYLFLRGVVTVDVKLDELDIQQCPMPFHVPNAFKDTCRCDFESTYVSNFQCLHFLPRL